MKENGKTRIGAPCIKTSVLHEDERAPSSPASSFYLYVIRVASTIWTGRVVRPSAGWTLRSKNKSLFPCPPGHGHVTRLKLSPTERPEILNTHTDEPYMLYPVIKFYGHTKNITKPFLTSSLSVVHTMNAQLARGMFDVPSPKLPDGIKYDICIINTKQKVAGWINKHYFT
jgi:hypothetical protein